MTSINGSSLTNAMSVDVEDYFQVYAFEHVTRGRDWETFECRIPYNTDRILEMFAGANVRATFFTLGWVAKRYPDLVRRIVAAGHELASHGMNHVRASQQSPDEFREDVKATKQLLEDVGGCAVQGYRAASYSIGAKNLWALDVLAECGHTYSSSIYPIRHDFYGMPEAPRFAFQAAKDRLREIPVTTVQLLGQKIPCGGGGYFRLLPYGYSKWAIKRVNQVDGQAAVFYFHPWEIDPDQPRFTGAGWRSNFRHYTNLDTMEKRIRRLLSDFKWDRMDRVFFGRRSGMSEHAFSQANDGVGSATLNVDFFTATDSEEWDKFVTAHPDGTFFHLSAWARVLQRAFGHRPHYIVAKQAGRIVGVLPLARVRSLLFGDALASTPFCVYGGALGASVEVRSALENRAAQLADELQVDHLELRNAVKTREDWPIKELYFTFRKQLDADPEKNMLAIPRKQRAEVRAGIKKNLQVEFDTDTARLYSIYSTSVRALGTPVFGRNYFDVLREEFGSACEIATVVHGDKPVASLLTFWFRDEVLPYYGGGLPDARPLSAYDFLYWDLMRRACERGTRIYDFGRSKLDTGPYRYKKHWGFEPQPLPYAYHLVRSKAMPNLSPTNPKYKHFIEAWKRVPLPITQWIGPMVARYLG